MSIDIDKEFKYFIRSVIRRQKYDIVQLNSVINTAFATSEM